MHAAVHQSLVLMLNNDQDKAEQFDFGVQKIGHAVYLSEADGCRS